MTKNEALKKLESHKSELQKRKVVYEALEKSISTKDPLNGIICKPKNEIEYQEILKDIKESGDE